MAAITPTATAATAAPTIGGAATTGLRPSGLINLPPAGAITSPIFDPPSSCGQLTTSTDFSSQLWLGYDEDCLPLNYFAVYAGTTGRAYYSPALCPIGWTSYPWVDTGYGPPQTVGETIMDCCQSGVTPVSLNFCQGEVTSSTTAQIETAGLFSSVATITGTTSILANLIQIRYQSTDCSVLGLCSGKSSSSSTSSKSSPTTSNSGSPTPPPPPPPPASKGGLSTGAKAAIGVVIPVVVIAALLLAFFLARRRKQKKARENAVAPDHQAPQMGMAPQQQPQYYQGQPGMPQPQYQGYPPLDQQQQLDKGMIVGGGPIPPNYSGDQSVNGNKHFSTQTTNTVPHSPSAPQYSSQVASPTSPAPIYEAPGHDPISPAPAAVESPSQFKAQPADEFYVPHVPVAPSGQAEADEAAAIQKELDDVRAERKRISTMEELSKKETELQERLNKVGGPTS